MNPTPFDIFVLPFTVGMSLLFAYLILKYASWIWYFDRDDKLRILRGLFSLKSLKAVKEIFLESLVHRKMFLVNRRLGYMHFSLAFGWFLLIVIGAFEAHIYMGGAAPFYFPIFFVYFVPDDESFFFARGFVQLMDASLLLVLSGVVVAIVKRFYKRIVGMRSTTNLRLRDKMVLYSLWLIFPLRLLAESATCGLHGSGGFLTYPVGQLMAATLPLKAMEYPLWWAYSIDLCLFFIGLPFSRYMHIPTEMVLIFFKNWGIRLKPDNPILEEVMVLSCPRCGVCIDRCQLNTAVGNHDTQAVYFLQRIRNHEQHSAQAKNCLMCGRCESVCPVGIDLNAIRLRHRQNFTPETFVPQYNNADARKVDVVFFTGCMGHLVPKTKDAMVKILNASGDRYWFMDADGGICCGRPMKLAGQTAAAQKLMAKNRQSIIESGARTLVTSCPICYKVFREDYNLEGIEILHHTEYIKRLIDSGKIKVDKKNLAVAYHDPCELGRGAGIFEPPRDVLSSVATLQVTANERKNSLCCGGSLANLTLPSADKARIAERAMCSLTANHPDVVATACPLCKKTLARTQMAPVADVAELVAEAMKE